MGQSLTGKTLDLSKDFVFNFTLHFGGGISNNGMIADGFVFVMTTTPVSNSLIGTGVNYIGYGDGPSSGILNSFAIEFDTEYNSGEGGPGNLPFINDGDCHTSYLQNGSMAAIPGTFKPMQDSFATVRNKSICVKIVWKRTNGVDASGGYDLITYIEELSTGVMVERNDMHFATLGDLISGLSQANSKLLEV